VKLGEVCERVEAVKRKNKDPEEELLYLDIGGIDNSVNKILSHKNYKWKDAPSRAQQIVFKDDVLFSTVRTYMKNIAVVENKIYDGQIASSGFCVIRSDKKITNPKFVFFYTVSQNFLRPLNELQTGSSYPAVRDKDVFIQPFPLPPKPIQQAIVSKIEELFSELDKGIENLRTAQQQLKTYRKSVLKWAFEGKLTNENVKEGELPKGWKWVPLHEMIDKIRCGSGVVPSSEISDYPILRSSSVRTCKVNFNDIKYVHEIEKIKKDDFIVGGDLLFTRLNGSIDYVGNCAIVPDFFPNNLIYPDRLFRMRLLKPEYADYVMLFFATSIARRIIEKNAKSTAGHMRISTPDITHMLIPLCPDKVQSKIIQEIESRLSVADKMEESITQSLQQAEALRQSILKKAFEGSLA
jgi:type I restriction enzyme, S subunit